MSKSAWLLILILGLALFVRLWGIDYGLPYFLIDDERSLVYTSLKMAELKTLIPTLHPDEFKIAFYAPLMSYVYLLFFAPFILIKYLSGSFSDFEQLAGYFVLNPGSLWLIARVVNALMGTAAVYLVYLVGKKIGNAWLGLISASLMAFSFYNIQFSHFTRPWGPAVFFICLIMLFSVYIFRHPKKKHYLLAGVAGALGFGAHYATAFGMAIFFIAHYFSQGPSFLKRTKDKKMWLAVLIFSLMSAVFVFANTQLFLSWTGLARLAEYSSSAKSLGGYFNSLVGHFNVILFLEPVILLFSLLGAILLLFRSLKMFFIALSWPIIYLSFLYLFFYQEFHSPIAHYVILIIPWLAVLAGFGIFQIISRLPNYVKIIFVILLLAYPLSTALQYDFLLSKKDSRIIAKEWVEENIPAGSAIISDWSRINPVPTKEAILFQEKLDKNSLRIADRILLATSDETYPKPAYYILRLAYLSEQNIPLNDDYRYFLSDFWEEESLSAQESEIIKKSELIAEFGPKEPKDIHSWRFVWPISDLFLLERLGPTVRIYKIK